MGLTTHIKESNEFNEKSMDEATKLLNNLHNEQKALILLPAGSAFEMYEIEGEEVDQLNGFIKYLGVQRKFKRNKK
jgi:hypothetical protein